MMKKRYLVLSLTAGLPFLVAATPAPATNETTTDGFIEFTTGATDNVTAVDPLFPDLPIQTDKAATSGDYSIIYASDFQFGSHEIASGDATYYAKNPTVTRVDGTTNEVPNFVEVLDRSGSKNGWHLTAKFSQSLASQSGNKIAGATMTFKNIQANSTGGFSEEAITLGQQVTIAADTQESATIAKDAEGKTAGFWIITFGRSVSEAAQSVSLFIPNTDKIQAGSYSTSLTWNFEAAL